MENNSKTRRLSRFATLSVAAVALGALAIPLQPAKAAYLGLDVGGVDVGVGVPGPYYGYGPDYGYYGPYYHHYYRPYYGYGW